MQQQGKLVQKVKYRVEQAETKLEKRMPKLEKILEESSLSEEEQQLLGDGKVGGRGMSMGKKQLRQMGGFKGQSEEYGYSDDEKRNERELNKVKDELEEILKQYQKLLERNKSVSYRYLILREWRQKMNQQVDQLRKQIDNTNTQITKSKNYQQQMIQLQQQHKVVQSNLIKLQMNYASTYRQERELGEKVQGVQCREYFVKWKYEKEKEVMLDAEMSGLLRENERWDKLMEKRDMVECQIEGKSREKNKQYSGKARLCQEVGQRLNGIDGLYVNLVKTIKQQQRVINNMMKMQGIGGDQLVKEVRLQFGYEGIGEWGDDDDVNRKLRMFRNNLGVVESLGYEEGFERKKEEIKEREQREELSQMSRRGIPYQSKSRDHQDNKNTDKKAQQRMSFPANLSLLPQIRSKYLKKSYPSSQVFPVTHQNDITKQMKRKNGSRSLNSKKQRLNSLNILPKQVTNEIKYGEFKKEARIRMKDGYKYYQRGDKTVSLKLENDEEDKSKNQFMSNYENRERLEIVKIYDRLVKRKPEEKVVDDDGYLSQITEPMTKTRSKQLDKLSGVSPNAIKLSPSRHPKKSKTLYRQVMQCRESDTQKDDNSTTRWNTSYLEDRQSDVLTNRSQFERERRKELGEEVEGEGRKRLNTIHQNQEEGNHCVGGSRNK